MRYIIYEQPYERPIVAGVIRYERNGEPTGAVEQYRVTAAVDGYRFLRVDLDARQAPSGRSTLYHTTLNPAGEPEQLKYRFWGDGLEVAGAVVLDKAQLMATRDVNGVSYEDETTATAFWFPSAAGLALLRPLAGSPQPVDSVTLNQETGEPSQAMALLPANIYVSELAAEQFNVLDNTYLADVIDITLGGQRRQVWLHKDGWPLRVERDDGLTGIATQLVIYR